MLHLAFLLWIQRILAEVYLLLWYVSIPPIMEMLRQEHGCVAHPVLHSRDARFGERLQTPTNGFSVFMSMKQLFSISSASVL